MSPGKPAKKSKSTKTTTGKKTDKNRHIRKAYGVKLLTAKHKDLIKLKKQVEQPSIHGNKFWGSSYLLMDYLQQHPPKQGCRVLEIGCGWGLAGIHCAVNYQAEVTGVDADDAVFPFLQLHAKHNKVSIDTLKRRFEKITTKQLAEYDLIIGADICFWDELADVVYKLVKRACKAGVDKIIIADPERSPFFTMAERCVDKLYAEIEERAVDKPKPASGALMIIENA